MIRLMFPLTLVAVMCCGSSISAQDSVKQSAALDLAFEKLKDMSGKWKIANNPGKLPPGAEIHYRVIGGGSTVVETLFPGTPKEMLSVYHRDGEKLVMTHYCALGNQPRFEGHVDKKTGNLHFTCVGGCNVNRKKGMHVHSGSYRFINADRVLSHWEFCSDGKTSGAVDLELKRIP